MVTWDPVLRRQLEVTPDTVTLPVHFCPTSPFGNLGWCSTLREPMDALVSDFVLGHTCLVSVPGSPSTGTGFSLNLVHFVPPRSVVFV